MWVLVRFAPDLISVFRSIELSVDSSESWSDETSCGLWGLNASLHKLRKREEKLRSEEKTVVFKREVALLQGSFYSSN